MTSPVLDVVTLTTCPEISSDDNTLQVIRDKKRIVAVLLANPDLFIWTAAKHVHNEPYVNFHYHQHYSCFINASI